MQSVLLPPKGLCPIGCVPYLPCYATVWSYVETDESLGLGAIKPVSSKRAP